MIKTAAAASREFVIFSRVTAVVYCLARLSGRLATNYETVFGLMYST